LFCIKEYTKIIWWHKEHKVYAMLRHPTDGSQWQGVDIMFLEYVEDARNARFGLRTDDMNHFGQ
jgi:hypothetical protein